MSIGENIRIKREKLGISQTKLAMEAGVTSQMINQIERGTKNPSLQVGREIARCLGCSMDNHMGRGRNAMSAFRRKS